MPRRRRSHSAAAVMAEYGRTRTGGSPAATSPGSVVRKATPCVAALATACPISVENRFSSRIEASP